MQVRIGFPASELFVRIKMKKLLFVLILILFFGCSTKNVTSKAHPHRDIESKYAKHLEDGRIKLKNKYPEVSIDKYFEPIIEAYIFYYGNSSRQIYCSRGLKETLFYLAMSADKKENAVAISQLWADAFYLKGYASFDLGNMEDAKTFVEKALELSPLNSMYLSELGHIYQTEKKWIEAMELYKKAENSAKMYSPESVRDTELTRAMRGIGYCLIELGRLDEAEDKYKICLEINVNDEKALSELKYIQGLRNENIP
jgi:tetratricopeptide (TPR) repeat protein